MLVLFSSRHPSLVARARLAGASNELPVFSPHQREFSASTALPRQTRYGTIAVLIIVLAQHVGLLLAFNESPLPPVIVPPKQLSMSLTAAPRSEPAQPIKSPASTPPSPPAAPKPEPPQPQPLARPAAPINRAPAPPKPVKQQPRHLPPVVAKTPSATKAPAQKLSPAPAANTPAPTTSTAPKTADPPATSVSPPMGRAGYLNNPAPTYPAAAARRRQEGVTRLRVHVQPDGSPDEVEIARSSGFSSLDEAAVAAVRRWTFIPAKQGNSPVAGWVEIPLEFKLAR